MVAEQLNAENALRQEISRKIFIEAEAMLAQQERIETAIVLAKEGWHAGVIGIVASRLVDKYHLPTILILSLIHISEPTRLGMISYAVFCLKKKKKRKNLSLIQIRKNKK